MKTVIFRTIAPFIVAVMIVFAIYVSLRGHNEPGGGFIGGLIAASSMAVFGMASGVDAVRKALKFDPLGYAGFGVFIAGFSGLLSLFTGSPFLTSIWLYLPVGRDTIPFSTPMVFDIGVFFVVFGTLTSVALALEDDGGAIG
ncbi:MnhB domain-containing protein [Devosia algicola]|uniref:MnhB domain-containing protein n=1 Tax=Devosia algicola TaxID=3026418 RepID=A0ABY7YN35_9HYPH|nr:MnhB domain-containing protein [Devosia algicola]WDR02721.1 MnhB domain-containing protein [Devosia algicola]